MKISDDKKEREKYNIITCSRDPKKLLTVKKNLNVSQPLNVSLKAKKTINRIRALSHS